MLASHLSGSMPFQDVDKFCHVQCWPRPKKNMDVVNTAFLLNNIYVKIFSNGIDHYFQVAYQCLVSKDLLTVFHNRYEVVNQREHGIVCSVRFIHDSSK
jgi:hypothetical protein